MKKKNFFLDKYKKTSHSNNSDKPNLNNTQFEKIEAGKSIPKKRLTAIYLTLIGTDNASEILKHLGKDETEKIIQEILNLKKITKDEILEVEKKFGKFKIHNLKKVINGKKFAEELLNKSFDKKKAKYYFE